MSGLNFSANVSMTSCVVAVLDTLMHLVAKLPATRSWKQNRITPWNSKSQSRHRERKFVNVDMQTITHVIYFKPTDLNAPQPSFYIINKLKAVVISAGLFSSLDPHKRREAPLAESQEVKCVSRLCDDRERRLFRHSLTWLSKHIQQLLCTETDFNNTMS